VVNIDIKNAILELKLSINSGEFIAIVGDSGGGKTTLLRVIAGLERANGVIEVNGAYWLKNNRSLPPQKRSIGFVMQDYALFENMSVIENLLFVKKDYSLAKRLLKSVDLWNLKDRLPNSLSGGQKQRVALTRAIIKKPKLLLLDEPLSALHPAMRYTLQQEILDLHKEFNLTTLLVSHDISEVAKLANRVISIENGKIKGIKNIDKTTNEQEFLLAQVIDKKVNSNKYQFIVNVANSTITLSVDRLKFNSYNIGDFIELGVKI
jgi:molybdate transport system ATP-binding protein